MDDVLTGDLLRARVDLVLRVPMPRALGIVLLDRDDAAAGAVLEVEGLALNGAGGVHAAALGALTELAGYLALAPHLTAAEHAVTHTSSVSLLAPAPAGRRVEAHGVLDRRGSRLAFLAVTATCDGVLVARSQLVKSIVPMGG